MPDPLSNRLELNCDLGEGEPEYLTGALMGAVSSVNIACGGHAGNRRTLHRCLELARTLGINAGAHPGLPEAFGRGESSVTPGQFRDLLSDQLERFCEIARAQRVRLHHVKLHGTLYHATERDERLRTTFLELVLNAYPGAIVYALAGGRTVAAARAIGLQAWDEAFADRGYRDDGTLVPRGEPGALITDSIAVADRVKRLAAGRPIITQSGAELVLQARTVCIHADSAGSVAMALAIREVLSGHARGTGPAGV